MSIFDNPLVFAKVMNELHGDKETQEVLRKAMNETKPINKVWSVSAKELTDTRNAEKKRVKKAGLFLKCKDNVIYLKNGNTIKFVVDDLDFPDEHLPPEAFEGMSIYAQAAKEQIE